MKEKEDKKERKRGQMLVLGRERALGVGLCEVCCMDWSWQPAYVCVNRIGMLLQEQRNQHQLPLIQKP